VGLEPGPGLESEVGLEPGPGPELELASVVLSPCMTCKVER